MRRYARVKYPPYQFYDERIEEIQDIEEKIQTDEDTQIVHQDESIEVKADNK